MAPTTVLCGSLSRHPVSLGAVMHRAGYAALGLDYVYVPFECRDLAGALGGMRALGIRGFGVSMPFKIEILPAARPDRPAGSDRLARSTPSSTTEDRSRGYNTDAFGAVTAFREAAEPRGCRVVVMGLEARRARFRTGSPRRGRAFTS